MGNKEILKPAQVIAALQASAGIYSHAAAKLGCAPNTVKNYVHRHKRVRKALDEILERNVDLAETQLLRMIRDQEHRGHVAAVIFYLKTKGRDRGYIERTENAVLPGGEVHVFLPKEASE